MSVIEDIFRGKYHPSDVKPDSEEFRTAEARVVELAQKLEETFSAEQKAWWKDFITNTMITQELYSLEYYRRGVIFGTMLMEEVLGARKQEPSGTVPEGHISETH